MNDSSIFTNVLWYLEFFAFVFTLVVFFNFFLYIARLNYVNYARKNDYKAKVPRRVAVRPPPRPIDKRPICCDSGCVWFGSLVLSILTIGLCLHLAYTLLSDTKLRFGLFMP